MDVKETNGEALGQELGLTYKESITAFVDSPALRAMDRKKCLAAISKV